MTRKPTPICGEHKIKKQWLATTFEYRDKGIVVRIPNVPAWICPEDGEASFTSDTTDELIATVRELIDTAKRAKSRRSLFTEYVVAVNG
jgi:YgiT-type zinc finger domain-containing protein